ncbi:MAG: hypothetical protein WCQ72_03045 [Eubacteriales bacterium]
MKTELNDYDIYPKVIETGKPTEITMCGLGAHSVFSGEYTLHIHGIGDGALRTYPDRHNDAALTVTADTEGKLRFTHTFESEQEYYIRLYRGEGRVTQLSVYAVGGGLAGCIPLMGDLHMHTFRSDGRESPAMVAANYRSLGYDFMAITDHGRYYPSLEVMKAYEDTEHDICLVPGEEIHLPGNDIHIVGFGAHYSINGLLQSSRQYIETNGDKMLSALDVTPPDALTDDQYRAEVEALADTLAIPAGIERFTYAACVWIFNSIRKAGGLGIFAHPYWISDMFQVPEQLTEYIMQTKPFDAFEVLGGENYYEQNGFQTQKYIEDRAKGRVYPIVGSTDTHSSFSTNRNYDICRTMVFAPANERSALIDSIKAGRSVALDTISREVRLVGEFRYVKYAYFLLENYFPLHDEIARWDGRLMSEYQSLPESERAETAADIARQTVRMKRFREKYISFAH